MIARHYGALIPSNPPMREGKADDGPRTRDLRLGKPTLYQLSYVRVGHESNATGRGTERRRRSLGGMRRRIVPPLLAALAAAIAVWRRRTGRAAGPAPASPPTGVPGAAAPAAGAGRAPAPTTAAAPDAATAAGATPAPPSERAGRAASDATPGRDAAATPAGAAGPRAAAGAPRTGGPVFASVPWALAIDPAAARGRTELPIRVTLLGEGMALDRVDVRETDSQVFVTVLARYTPPDRARPAVRYGVARDAVVPLAAPLGERTLVHAPDDLDRLDELAGG